MSAYLSIGDLANVVLPRSCRNGLIGMLTVYFDDSGTHDSADVTLLAGLFGLENQWVLFERLWRDVLETAIPNKSVSHFHAAECNSSVGDFLGWSRTETDYLMHELGRVIVRCGLAGCATAIERKAWDRLVTGDLRRTAGDAERGCLQVVFLDTIYWAQRFVPHEGQIAFVFDDRPQRRRQYEIVYGIFADEGKTVGNKVDLVSLTFARAKKVLPLQAADLFAWEVYQEEMARLKQPLPPGRFHRQMISDLVKTGKFRMRMGDREAIIEGIPIIEKLIRPEDIAEIDRLFGKT